MKVKEKKEKNQKRKKLEKAKTQFMVFNFKPGNEAKAIFKWLQTSERASKRVSERASE